MPLESSLTAQKHCWACCPKLSIYEGPGQGLGIILCILKIKFTEMYYSSALQRQRPYCSTCRLI